MYTMNIKYLTVVKKPMNHNRYPQKNLKVAMYVLLNNFMGGNRYRHKTS